MKRTKEELRKLVCEMLPEIISGINSALRGEDYLSTIHPTLMRNGKGGKIPHWYEELSKCGTLPNLDGKSIGSVVEMLLIGVLEATIFKSLDIPPLHINPARGIDLPDLDLGVKSPSKNYCTSEPFFSAYERLFGSEYDALVLLTDYQIAKKTPPLKLQIIGSRYVTKSQLADRGLCRIARKHRARMLESGESRAQRLFRFLAFVNQSDWLGSKLVSLIDAMDEVEAVRSLVEAAERDFKKTNAIRDSKGKLPLSDSALQSVQDILKVSPTLVGLTDAADNWVAENLKDSGRLPNDNEWNRLKFGPLDGQIGMSPALQWRYNFGSLFGKFVNDVEEP
jgi:hypothetical protein